MKKTYEISERENSINNVIVYRLPEAVPRTDGERGSVSNKNLEDSTTDKEIAMKLADKLGFNTLCIKEVITIPSERKSDRTRPLKITMKGVTRTT